MCIDLRRRFMGTKGNDVRFDDVEFYCHKCCGPGFKTDGSGDV